MNYLGLVSLLIGYAHWSFAHCAVFLSRDYLITFNFQRHSHRIYQAGGSNATQTTNRVNYWNCQRSELLFVRRLINFFQKPAAVQIDGFVPPVTITTSGLKNIGVKRVIAIVFALISGFFYGEGKIELKAPKKSLLRCNPSHLYPRLH